LTDREFTDIASFSPSNDGFDFGAPKASRQVVLTARDAKAFLKNLLLECELFSFKVVISK